MTGSAAVAKMSLSSAFVATALVVGALDTSWGTWLLAGLVASWLGDFALLGRGRPAFVAGLAAFLIAHVLYIAGFFSRGIDGPATVASAGFMAAFGAVVLVWLRPHTGSLFAAVAAYVVAISAMVATGVGTHADASAWGLAVGAIGFAVSDMAVAKDRFVTPGVANRRWGLPVYFASQFLIAVAAGG